MTEKVVLLDLEQNTPTLKLMRDIVQHYSTLYVFNCTGKFAFALDDLTELASLIVSGQIVVLDVPETEHKEDEYAVLVGQLMASLEENTHVELISAVDSSQMLMQMLEASNIPCGLIQIQAEAQAVEDAKPKQLLPSLEAIQAKPYLQLVKKYCDALAHMTGKPNTLESLKNSVGNILQLVPEKAQKVVGMLINLKIVKRYDQQINIRKKVLKQWVQLNVEQTASQSPAQDLAKVVSTMVEKQEDHGVETGVQSTVQQAQQHLFKNFAQVDPVQMEVIRKLRQLQGDKPKDIYELRDLLESLFPKSDIRLLLKELLDKGYIYWNGHEVLYSYEMFLN